MKRTGYLLIVFFLLVCIPLSHAQDTKDTVTIGWVMDSRGMNDAGFNDMTNGVLTELAARANVKIIRVPRLDLFADKTLEDLLALDADVIIATDESGMSGAMFEAALRNPAVQFILIGAEGAPLSNLASVIFEEDEAGYMAGFIAASVTKTDTIAFIGAAPFDPIKRFEYGFIGGATDANKDIETMIAYIGDRGDVTALYNRDKTGETAMRLTKKGADVIFCVSDSGSVGAHKAAEKMNTTIIGLGNDEKKAGVKNVTTSIIFRYDTAIKNLVTRALNHEAVGGTYLMGFENGGLDYTALSSYVGPETIRRIAEKKALLAKGRITVPNYLVERRKTDLVVSLNVTMPPYEYIDEDGLLVGYVVDVMEEVGRRLGREVTFNSFSGSRIPSGLTATRSDIEPMVMIDEERTASFITGEPWGVGESVIVVKKNELVPKEIFELISKNVGVVSGSPEEAYILKLPGIFHKGFSSAELCLMSLAWGEVDAAIVNKDEADFFLSDKLEDEDLIILERPVIISPYAVAMPRPGDPAFLAQIDSTLKSMKDDGTIKKLSRRWFE